MPLEKHSATDHNRRMLDSAAVGTVIAALGLAYQILKSESISRKDKKKIETEAKRLVELAQMSDIDEELKRRPPMAHAKKVASKKARPAVRKALPKRKR